MKNKFSTYIEEYFQTYQFANQFYLNFDETIIKVKTNHKKLAIDLKKYFREFLTEETKYDSLVHLAEAKTPNFDLKFKSKPLSPGKTKVKEEYVDFNEGRIIRKIQTGLIFMFDGQNNLAVGPCVQNLNQAINFINNRFMEIRLKQGALLLHASGISFNNKGLAIAGFSGAGKSTLALHLLKNKINFVSNDRVLMDRKNKNLIMTGVAKYPRINPGTIISIKEIENILPVSKREKYRQLDKNDLWNLEEKYDLLINEVYGANRFQLKAEMKALVILNWQHNEEKTIIKELNPSERYDLFPAFMKSAGLFYFDQGIESIDKPKEIYNNFLQDCQVFEVTGGVDFKQTTDYFIDYIIKL